VAAALLTPAYSDVADTSTDATGAYLDDATITTKVKSVKAVHNNLKVNVVLNEGEVAMKGYVQDIESIAVKNVDFRQVLYTAKNCQLVVMALKPQEGIGAEVHKLDQFFRVEEGTGEAVLNGVRTPIRAGFAVVVPAGVNHNIINTGSVPLKLYTLYAPPNHRDGVVHHTRADAEADNEHFDGKTTE
jgi:mannose-6-phosphate isomerase-like protein (cupin superfamily)